MDAVILMLEVKQKEQNHVKEGKTMTEKQTDILQESISELTNVYSKAVKQEYILKPMAYALYTVWKEFDGKNNKKNGKDV